MAGTPTSIGWISVFRCTRGEPNYNHGFKGWVNKHVPRPWRSPSCAWRAEGVVRIQILHVFLPSCWLIFLIASASSASITGHYPPSGQETSIFRLRFFWCRATGDWGQKGQIAHKASGPQSHVRQFPGVGCGAGGISSAPIHSSRGNGSWCLVRVQSARRRL